jgi:hypothetical protein
VRTLQLAAREQVETLVGAAEFDVALECHRVVALHKRIEKLVQRYRIVRAVTLLEVVALEHARDGHLARKTQEIGRIQFR